MSATVVALSKGRHLRRGAIAVGFAMVGVLFTMTASPDRAFACTGNPIEAILGAHLVVAGPVVAVEPPFPSYDPATRSRTVTVRSERYLKGDGETLVQFKVFV